MEVRSTRKRRPKQKEPPNPAGQGGQLREEDPDASSSPAPQLGGESLHSAVVAESAITPPQPELSQHHQGLEIEDWAALF